MVGAATISAFDADLPAHRVLIRLKITMIGQRLRYLS
ncbi:hypothetical protein MYIN104542_30065 [Mycobacterium intermedium]